MTPPISENSSPAPASVAPQGLWAVEHERGDPSAIVQPLRLRFSLEECEAVTAAHNCALQRAVQEFIDAHHNPIVAQLNSRLREKEKEIEGFMESVILLTKERDKLSAQLTVAREALEKICGQTDPGTFEHKVANSALSSLHKRVVNTPHPSPTESAFIPEHGDVIP